MPKLQRGIRRPSDFSPMSDEVLRTTVIPLFETISERYADRPAIRRADCQLSYRELNGAANALAHQISVDLGEDSSPIAFLFEDEVLSIATFMAILKTGRAYVGLDPRLAPEQRRLILEDSTASLLITDEGFKDAASGVSSSSGVVRTMLLEELDTASGHPNPGRRIEPNAPYAIFYTSGSEGGPKGVLQGHLTRSQITLSKSHTWCLAPSDRISQLTSVSHAASYSGLWGALLSGAVLCLFDPRGQTGRQGLEWMVNEQLTILQAPPSVFQAMVGPAPDGLIFPRLRLIALGSEPVSSAAVELLESHTPEDCVLLNYYASTEAGSICEYPVHHGGPRIRGPPACRISHSRQAGPPAGCRRPGTTDHQEGEIAVRSRYLSIGYWRQPDLTAAKFQVDPVDPEMVPSTRAIWDVGARTARWKLLGRRDMLVKIRGFGVQLEALDLALRALPGVAEAAAIVDRPNGRSARLVAYLVMDPGHSFSPGRFRKSSRSVCRGTRSLRSLCNCLSCRKALWARWHAVNCHRHPRAGRPSTVNMWRPATRWRLASRPFGNEFLACKGSGLRTVFFDLAAIP